MSSFGYTILGFGGGTVDSLLTGLEAWWSLDESSGTRTDSHNSIALTDNNTVASASGQISNGADFERADLDYLRIASPIPSNLQFADEDFTIAGWVKIESVHTTPYYFPMISYNNGSGGTAANVAYQIVQYHNGSNYVCYFNVSDGSTRNLVESDTLSPPTATWYHIIAEHDATADTISIALNNGTPQSTAHTAGCHAPAFPFTMSAFEHLIGNFPYHGDGIMDEWAIWRRTLTSNEKARLYNSGSGMGYPG
jgi:hypothetical protein